MLTFRWGCTIFIETKPGYPRKNKRFGTYFLGLTGGVWLVHLIFSKGLKMRFSVLLTSLMLICVISSGSMWAGVSAKADVPAGVSRVAVPAMIPVCPPKLCY